jgi:hypothetical protein
MSRKRDVVDPTASRCALGMPHAQVLPAAPADALTNTSEVMIDGRRMTFSNDVVDVLLGGNPTDQN